MGVVWVVVGCGVVFARGGGGGVGVGGGGVWGVWGVCFFGFFVFLALSSPDPQVCGTYAGESRSSLLVFFWRFLNSFSLLMRFGGVE